MTRQTNASTLTCHDVRERLELYLDQALPQVESKALQAHLSVCANCRAEVGVAEAVEKQLRDAFRHEAPPHQLWPRIAADLHAEDRSSQNVERPSVWRFSRWRAIAASALFAIGVVLAGRRLMTTGIDRSELMQTPLDELRSFVDSGRPLDVATTDPAKLRQWFMPKVDFPPPMPPTMSDLSLVGGRLCYFFRRRVAAYMYHADGHVLSLYVMSDRDIEMPSSSDAMLGGRPAAVREFDGFAHILWRDGTLCYSLVSNQPADRLIQVAQAIAMATG
jgi:anti-sigma factor (TIGR02949 family)